MGFLRRLSLQFQIAAGVILGVVLLLSIFGWQAVRTINQSKDVALEERLRLAQTTAQSVDALLEHTTRQLESAAVMSALGSNQSEQEQMEFTYGVLETFDRIVRLDADGQVIWAVPPILEPGGWPFANEPQLLQATGSNQASLLQLSSPRGSHPPIAIVIVPLRAGQAGPLGYLAGELHLAHAGFDLVTLPEQEETVHSEVVDGQGYIIAQSGEDTYEPEAHAEILAEFIAKGESGTAVHYVDGDPDHVVAYYPLESLPGGVVVEQRKDRALAIPRRLERNLLWTGLGAVVVASAGVWLHSRSVVRPIRELTKASATIAAGGLDDPIHMRREDEVGQLARSFEAMRLRLRESQEQRLRWEEELESRVRQRTQEVQSLLRRIISAQEEERMRIARELHDESAQDLLALLAGVQAAEMALPGSPQKAKEVLTGVKPSAKRALEDMRKSILELRPSALDDLGLAPAIRGFAESRLRLANIELRWEAVDELDDLPEPTTIALFRIAQAAINNVVQHSQASHVRIHLSSTESHVAIEVQDDGLGFDFASLRPSPTDTRGLGILGMKERANLIGGTVELDSEPGQGTTVRIRAPIRPGDGNHE